MGFSNLIVRGLLAQNLKAINEGEGCVVKLKVENICTCSLQVAANWQMYYSSWVPKVGKGMIISKWFLRIQSQSNEFWVAPSDALDTVVLSSPHLAILVYAPLIWEFIFLYLIDLSAHFCHQCHVLLTITILIHN